MHCSSKRKFASPCLPFLLAGKGWLVLSCLAFIAVYPSELWSQKYEPTSERLRSEKEISEPLLRAHMKFLSNDLLEGRGPAGRGDKLAQLYIATQLESLGMQPAGKNGWVQPVPLVGVITHAPSEVQFTHASANTTWKYFDEYIATAGLPEKEISLSDREVVFVGYGIQAPEYQWDDFKGVDLKGKILLMMNNDPANDPSLFAGKRRLYYGRWDYKFESAARQGAAGAIIIHTNESAGYPFKVIQTSWTGEEFELRGESGPRLLMKGWATDAAVKSLVANCGKDLDQLRAMAEKRDFQPVPLGAKFSIKMTCDVREQETANILGMLKGEDPQLQKEAVIYMAHHDHIGIAVERTPSGDMIYNGAIDNASGVASVLSIASAFAKSSERPKRSILFAFVGAEEQGLLGSKYLAEHPVMPPGRMAAAINIDGISFLGRTHDVNVIGGGKSNLDTVLEKVSLWQNRVVTQDHFPDRGFYYRSDQFSLAKIGVPAVYLHAGTSIVGKPSGWGKEQQELWIDKHYHQPSDEFDDQWDLQGAIEDAKLLYHVGRIIADQPDMPAWNAGDEFELARKKAIEALPKP